MKRLITLLACLLVSLASISTPLFAQTMGLDDLLEAIGVLEEMSQSQYSEMKIFLPMMGMEQRALTTQQALESINVPTMQAHFVDLHKKRQGNLFVYKIAIAELGGIVYDFLFYVDTQDNVRGVASQTSMPKNIFIDLLLEAYPDLQAYAHDEFLLGLAVAAKSAEIRSQWLQVKNLALLPSEDEHEEIWRFTKKKSNFYSGSSTQ